MYRYIYGLLMACLLWMVSCKNEDPSASDNGITLSVHLGAESLQVDSRATAADLIDGSCLNRVTMLIVDGSNKLVAIQDWNDIATTLPTQVSTTIRGLEPNTAYRMIAVANYGDLTNFPNLNLTVGNTITTIINQLNNYKLPETGNDYLVAQQTQPLSLVQEFTTPARGELNLQGELLRTYARIRIEIANRSESKVLSVNSLKFGTSTSKFGYGTTPLLPVADAHIPAANGNMNEKSTDALTPFAPVDIPTLNDEAGNSKVVFDGYLYECKNTAGFEYSLNVGYSTGSGGGTTSGPVYEKGTGTSYPKTSGLYMIGYGNNNRFLTVSGNNLSTSQFTKTELDPVQDTPVIWNITNTSGYYYTLCSMNNNKYINLTSSSVSLGDTSSEVFISSSSGQIRKSINNSNYYIYVKNNGMLSASRAYQTDFRFYPLTLKESSNPTSGTATTKDCIIPLETLIDGVPQPTYMIRRNDFINVLVTVSYNENYNRIDFEVKNWVEKNENVEFN